MRSLRLSLLGAAVVLALGMGTTGCTTLATVASSTTTASPVQITTFPQVTQGLTIATHTVDFAVNNMTLSRTQLEQLRKLNNAVHEAWVPLNDANNRGESLVYTAFAAAYNAFRDYSTQNGIPLAVS